MHYMTNILNTIPSNCPLQKYTSMLGREGKGNEKEVIGKNGIMECWSVGKRAKRKEILLK